MNTIAAKIGSSRRPDIDKGTLKDIERIDHKLPIESPAKTKGYLIRWGKYYDTVVNFLTLGQTKHLRTMSGKKGGSL